MRSFEYLIVGGGFSGLSIAALLAHDKKDVCLLERHTLLGGQASYYKKQGLTLDVGATTVSGFAHNGPLERLSKQLGLHFDTIPTEESIRIVMMKGEKGTQVIHRYRAKERWLEEIAIHFGERKLALWRELSSLNQAAWKMLADFESFPPHELRTLLQYLKNPGLGSAISLLPALFTPISHSLPGHGRYRSMIDEQLLISAQNDASAVSLLTASIGLSYPEDMFYPRGGIKALSYVLSRRAKELGVEIKRDHCVISVKKEGHDFILQSKKEIFRGKNVIFTIPIWNCAEISSGRAKKYYQKMSRRFSFGHGAFTVYLGLRFRSPEYQSYWQIHTHDIPLLQGGSIFLSLSRPDDELRNPRFEKNRLQAATISFHTEIERWKKIYYKQESNKRSYQEEKKRVELAVLTLLKKVFAFYNPIEEVAFIESGTPHTFYRYTERFEGRVGGIPHSILRPPFLFPGPHTPEKGLYHLGDTSYPGQGLSAVCQGALSLAHKLREKNE